MPESPQQPPPGRRIALAFAAAALAQLLRIPRLSPFGTFFLSLFAVLSLGRVFGETAEAADDPTDETPAASYPRLGLLLAAAGAAGAVACSILLHRHFARYLFPVLIAGPISLAILGLGADLFTPRPASLARGARATIWPLLLVLLVGALFRFGSIGWFPPPDGFSSIEEMQRATGGAGILHGQRPWEFPLAQYLDAATFALFGKSIYAVRLPATILAWLTLPVFYLLARRMVAGQAALFATALLAVSRWHCQVGWYNEDVYVPLLPFVGLLYLLVRTRRDPRPSLYVAAGALVGYMLYDYAAFRSAPFVALGFFATDALRRRQWPTDARRIALLFAVTLLFAWPLVGVLENGRGTNFYFEALDRSFAETGYYTSDPSAFVRRRLIRLDMAADVFTTSDHFEFFPTLNLPYAPLLDPFTSVFFVLGFGTTLLLWHRRHRAFVGLGFLALAMGAMILPWNLDFRRLAILVPFTFLFTAFVAEDVEVQARRGGWPRLWRGALITIVACATLANAWFLFGRLATDPTVRAAHRTPYSVVLDYLGAHYAGESLLILSGEMDNFFERNDYDWLKPEGLHGRMAEGVEDLLNPVPAIPRHGDLLLLIARPFDIQTVMSQVRDVYPNSSCELRRDPDDRRHDLGVCRVPQ